MFLQLLYCRDLNGFFRLNLWLEKKLLIRKLKKYNPDISKMHNWVNSFHELKFLHSNASTGVKELSVLESFLF